MRPAKDLTARSTLSASDDAEAARRGEATVPLPETKRWNKAKSGNGLRIFARHLWDTGQVGAGAFPVHTLGGVVQCEVLQEGREVFVEMGRACFASLTTTWDTA